MSDRHTCVSCGRKSPATNSDYTLISQQFGWRLARTRLPDGKILMEWRCPECWREYKKARDAGMRPALGSRPALDTDSSNVFRSPLGAPLKDEPALEEDRPRPPVKKSSSQAPKR